MFLIEFRRIALVVIGMKAWTLVAEQALQLAGINMRD